MTATPDSTDLQPVKPQGGAELILHDATDMFWDSAGFNHALRLGRMFAKSGLVPKHLDEFGCAIGVLMARQMRENPLTVLQAMYVVSGKPGWSAQYVIARAAQCGAFRGPIDWRIVGKGDDLEVTAFAMLAGSGAEVNFTASMAMARAEGWTSNKKYQTLPELMLRYRSATLLVRLYAPGVMLGLQTREEIEDVESVDVTPVRRGPPAIELVDEPLRLDPADAPKKERAPDRLSSLGLSQPKQDQRPAAAEGAAGAPGAAAAQVGHDVRGGPVPADPKADAEAIAAFVGLRTAATSECKEALKAAMKLARLDSARWNAAIAFGVSHDLLVDFRGGLRRPLSVDDRDAGQMISGADLRTEIGALEKDIDPEDAGRIYSASFEEAGEDVARFETATDVQLRRYLDALLTMLETAPGSK